MGRFCGRNGSNIKHVQGDSKARVYVPRDGSTTVRCMRCRRVARCLRQPFVSFQHCPMCYSSVPATVKEGRGSPKALLPTEHPPRDIGTLGTRETLTFGALAGGGLLQVLVVGSTAQVAVASKHINRIIADINAEVGHNRAAHAVPRNNRNEGGRVVGFPGEGYRCAAACGGGRKGQTKGCLDTPPLAALPFLGSACTFRPSPRPRRCRARRPWLRRTRPPVPTRRRTERPRTKSGWTSTSTSGLEPLCQGGLSLIGYRWLGGVGGNCAVVLFVCIALAQRRGSGAFWISREESFT